MFQVAPRPAHAHTFSGHGAINWEHDDISMPTASSYSPASSSNVQLPRTLARPAFTDINRAHIAAVAPELADVPAEYVRRGLRHKAPQMFAGLSALSPSHLPPTIPRSHLSHTPSLSIPIRSSGSSAPTYPTHILAITPASKSASQSEQIPLYPTHSLVLASHCANLPRLPPSASSNHSSTLALPVLPLSVPSPAAFPALHSYLYSHRADALLTALLPGLPSAFLASVSTSPASSSLQQTLASGPALHQLSVAVLNAQGQGGLAALMGLTKRVTGVWKDAVALGVYEPELWDALDLAWEVLLGSLNLAAGMS